MNDYEEGMRACFGAAKTWMAVSFTVSIFCCNASRPHARMVKCLHAWLLVATACEI